MDAKKITELALAKSGDTSIRQFATKLGVSHVAVLSWLDNSQHPSFEVAAQLAAIAELPIVKTASQVRLHSPKGKKHREILRRMAKEA